MGMAYNEPMAIHFLMRVVLDTNVIFEGLTKQGGVCGLIVDAWRANLLLICVSNTLIYEYKDVLSRKLSPERWPEVEILLDGLLNSSAEPITIYFSWRPISPDVGDDHVINCAMNANAPLITANIRDFRPAQQRLGLQVMTPLALVTYLTQS